MRRQRLSRNPKKLGRFARLKKHFEQDVEKFAEKHPDAFTISVPTVAGTGLFMTPFPVAQIVGGVFIVAGGLLGLDAFSGWLTKQGYKIHKVVKGKDGVHHVHVSKKVSKK